MNIKRMPRDRDYVETTDDLIFCVVDYIHPPNRVTAYLKYIPSNKGLWKKENKIYKRVIPYYHVRSVKRAIDFLLQHYPQYVHECSVRGMTFSMVPYNLIKRLYFPEERLAEIIQNGPKDSLEQIALDLVDLISSSANVNHSKMGITGSILVGIHNPDFSDIDLTIYGLKNSYRVRNSIKECLSSGNLQIRRIGKSLEKQLEEELVKSFKMDIDLARFVLSRRWNYAMFKGIPFSIHPIRSDMDITEKYGDRIYKFAGKGTIKAFIEDSTESIFTPAIYKVSIWEAKGKLQEIEEVVSFEGIFRDLFNEGDLIEARGKIEQVITRRRTYYRLVIGSLEEEGGYIRPLKVGE